MIFTHEQLVEKGIRWLKKGMGQNGAGCNVAISEFPSGFNTEIPDCIGYRFAGYMDGTTLIECKTSRADFLADFKKPHRMGKEENGVGNWRYYLAPQGLIKPSELPHKWGLIEIKKTGGCIVTVGAVKTCNYTEREKAFRDMRFKSNTYGELFILTRLLYRIGDAEKINDTLRENSRLKAQLEKMNQ